MSTNSSESNINPHIHVAFVNTDQLPLKVRIICYYTEPDWEKADTIAVFRVIEETYPHQDAPDDANILVTRTELVKKYSRREDRGAFAIILEAAQKNAAEILKRMLN